MDSRITVKPAIPNRLWIVSLPGFFLALGRIEKTPAGFSFLPAKTETGFGRAAPANEREAVAKLQAVGKFGASSIAALTEAVDAVLA